jgi:hypothetical protein
MNRKFDEHRPFGDAQHLATDVDDAPTQFETSVEQRPRRISTSTIVIGSSPSAPRWNRLSSPSSAIPTLGRHNCVCITSA